MYNLVFRQGCIMSFLLCGLGTPHTHDICCMFLKAHRHPLLNIFYTNDNRVVFEANGNVVIDEFLIQFNIECITELVAISRLLEMCNTKFASFYGRISNDRRWSSNLTTLKCATLDMWRELFADKGVHCKSVEITDSGITMHLESYSNEIYTISVEEGEIRINYGKFKTHNLRVLLECDLKN